MEHVRLARERALERRNTSIRHTLSVNTLLTDRLWAQVGMPVARTRAMYTATDVSEPVGRDEQPQRDATRGQRLLRRPHFVYRSLISNTQWIRAIECLQHRNGPEMT